MGKVIVSATMSLDGFVADEQDGVGELFGWYTNGETVVRTARADMSWQLSDEDAAWLDAFTRDLGALVVGRRLFDLTSGWQGAHPLGVPVVVLTHDRPDAWIAEHPDAPFTFVSEGIREAVHAARELADDRTVGVAAGNVGAQAIGAGLVDQLVVDLAPVVLGAGRPYFHELAGGPVRLGEPRIVPGVGAIHLVYDVQEHSKAEFAM